MQQPTPDCFGRPTFGDPCETCKVKGPCHDAQSGPLVLLPNRRVADQTSRSGARAAEEATCGTCGPTSIIRTKDRGVICGKCKQPLI